MYGKQKQKNTWSVEDRETPQQIGALQTFSRNRLWKRSGWSSQLEFLPKTESWAEPEPLQAGFQVEEWLTAGRWCCRPSWNRLDRLGSQQERLIKLSLHGRAFHRSLPVLLFLCTLSRSCAKQGLQSEGFSQKTLTRVVFQEFSDFAPAVLFLALLNVRDGWLACPRKQCFEERFWDYLKEITGVWVRRAHFTLRVCF